jgi:uncharacterized membrane protein
MSTNYIFVFAVGIGIVAGLRSMTAPAIVSWGVYLGALGLQGTRLEFMGSIVAVVIFSLFAVSELIVDKLPMTPKRTKGPPFVVRILMGALCGTCFYASVSQSMLIGAVLGVLGALIGTFAGYEIRRRVVSSLNIKDIFVALAEDLVAIGLACFLVFR